MNIDITFNNRKKKIEVPLYSVKPFQTFLYRDRLYMSLDRMGSEGTIGDLFDDSYSWLDPETLVEPVEVKIYVLNSETK